METSPNLIWIDLEMTGLNPEKDKIMEIAVVITDSNLNIVDESIDLIIHQPRGVINGMNAWCKKQPSLQKLARECLVSKTSLSDAKKIVYKIIKKYTEKNKGVLCGNSVYVDRMFLKEYLPRAEKYLSYRMIDVSSVKELAKRWYLDDVREFLGHKEVDVSHRALDDIKWSINELKFYREKIFKSIISL